MRILKFNEVWGIARNTKSPTNEELDQVDQELQKVEEFLDDVYCELLDLHQIWAGNPQDMSIREKVYFYEKEPLRGNVSLIILIKTIDQTSLDDFKSEFNKIYSKRIRPFYRMCMVDHLYGLSGICRTMVRINVFGKNDGSF